MDSVTFALNKRIYDVGGNSSIRCKSTNALTYVAWTWDAGTSTASNTDGSITSNVGLINLLVSRLLVTQETTNNSTVGHGLNAAPYVSLLKTETMLTGWAVFIRLGRR